jgi:Fe2+ transport system protein FeoA
MSTVAAVPAADFPLADAASGSRLRVTGIAAETGLERRLLELGLPRGAEIEVVKRLGRRNAPVVVAAFGARLAIGAAMARDIRVAPLAAVPLQAAE